MPWRCRSAWAEAHSTVQGLARAGQISLDLVIAETRVARLVIAGLGFVNRACRTVWRIAVGRIIAARIDLTPTGIGDLAIARIVTGRSATGRSATGHSATGHRDRLRRRCDTFSRD